MKRSDSPSAAGSGLQAAVRQQTWAWLVAICRRLNLSAEIVDANGELCSPVVTGPATSVVRRLLSEAGSPLLQSTLAAIESGRIESLTVKRLQIACCPIGSGAGAAGALVLARDPFKSKAAEKDVEDVAAAGSWLAHAVEAHLLSEEGPASALPYDRLTEIHRTIHAAAERGGERDVVLAFSEALAASDDLEVRGYVEDPRGRFILSVESHSGTAAEAPEVLETSLVPPNGVLKRLTTQDAERVGFGRERAVLMTRLGGESSTWVIALGGRIESEAEPLMSLYLNLLRQGMLGAERFNEAKLVRSISERLLAATEGAEAAVALEELSRAFDALGSALVVTASHGMQLLSVGDAEVFTAPRPPDTLDQIVSTLRVEDDTAVIAVRRPEGEPFTKHEQLALDRIAGLFGAWLPAVLQRMPSSRDRRSANREFEQIIEQAAARTIDEGAEVSALLISVSVPPMRAGILHRWAASLRGSLRASDVAGTLSDREVGVLLPGTGPVGAVAVGTRIQQRLETEEDDIPISAVIGLASRAPGSGPGSIVQAARADAARRSRTDDTRL